MYKWNWRQILLAWVHECMTIENKWQSVESWEMIVFCIHLFDFWLMWRLLFHLITVIMHPWLSHEILREFLTLAVVIRKLKRFHPRWCYLECLSDKIMSAHLSFVTWHCCYHFSLPAVIMLLEYSLDHCEIVMTG